MSIGAAMLFSFSVREVVHAVADVVDVLAEGRVADGHADAGVGRVQRLRVHAGGVASATLSTVNAGRLRKYSGELA